MLACTVRLFVMVEFTLAYFRIDKQVDRRYPESWSWLSGEEHSRGGSNAGAEIRASTTAGAGC